MLVPSHQCSIEHKHSKIHSSTWGVNDYITKIKTNPLHSSRCNRIPAQSLTFKCLFVIGQNSDSLVWSSSPINENKISPALDSTRSGMTSCSSMTQTVALLLNFQSSHFHVGVAFHGPCWSTKQTMAPLMYFKDIKCNANVKKSLSCNNTNQKTKADQNQRPIISYVLRCGSMKPENAIHKLCVQVSFNITSYYNAMTTDAGRKHKTKYE